MSTIILWMRVGGRLKGVESMDSPWLLWPLFIMGFALSRLVFKKMDVIYVSTVLMLASYIFYISAYWFFSRYFFVLHLGFLLLGSAIFEKVFRSLSKWPQYTFTVLTALVYAGLFALLGHYNFMMKNVDGNNIVGYYKGVEFIDNSLGDGTVVGALQSGVLGYFSEHRVVNLDGVVNSSAYRALKQKRILEYSASAGIEYILAFESNHDTKALRNVTNKDGKYYLMLKSPRGIPISLYKIVAFPD